jgi:hypothetical protein
MHLVKMLPTLILTDLEELEVAKWTGAGGKGIDRKGKHRWIKERKGRAPNYQCLWHSASKRIPLRTQGPQHTNTHHKEANQS